MQQSETTSGSLQLHEPVKFLYPLLLLLNSEESIQLERHSAKMDLNFNLDFYVI